MLQHLHYQLLLYMIERQLEVLIRLLFFLLLDFHKVKVHQHHLLSISTSALHQMDAFQLSNHPMLLVDVGMLPFCAWPAGRAPLTRDLLPLPRFTRPR